MKLYKYCPPERSNILKNCQISFSIPSNFNDPFDCLPSYKESEVLNPIGQRVYFQQAAPEDIVDPIKRKKLNAEILEHVKKSFEIDPAFALESVVQVEPIPNEDGEAALAAGFRGSMQAGAQDNKLILSLSEERNNLLMWAHYAAEHSGFIISFDTNHDYFNPEGTHLGTPGKLHRVIYTSRRPCGIFGTLPLHETYLTKSLDWQSEKEWRVIQDRKNASKSINVNGKSIHLFDIPPSCISEIILGARCEKVVEDEIRHILASSKNWSHVKLLRATSDEKVYQLNYCAIST